MAYNALMFPKFKWFDSNGDPATGWKLYTYEAGTTTPKVSYRTPSGTTNDNPVVLNSDGEADIYLDGEYKIVLKNASDVTQWTLDNVQGAAIEQIVASIKSTLADIGTGATDAELRLIAASPANFHTWDNDNSKWRVRSGNIYTTASLPTAASYTIETGTVIFDTTTNTLKRWNESAWVRTPPYSSETVLGIIEIATVAEHLTGTADTLAANPAGVKAMIDASAKAGEIHRPRYIYTITLPYTAKTGSFSIGDRVVGGTSGAEGTVEYEDTTNSKLYLSEWNGTSFNASEDLNVVTKQAETNSTESQNSIVMVGPAYFDHQGTASQLLSFTGRLAYEFSSLSVSDWSYLYIDDTNVQSVGGTTLTAAMLSDSTTEPSYDHVKGGWYNGSDRCIFAILTNGSNQIIEFYHPGGKTVDWADEIEDQAAVVTGVSYGDMSPLTIPSFATVARIITYGTVAGNNWWWRTNGQTGSIGKALGYCQVDAYGGAARVITDSSQTIECKSSTGNGAALAIKTQAWELPVGM